VRNTLSFAIICRVIGNLCGVATSFISIHLYNLYVTKEVYGTILVGLQIIGYLPIMSGGFRMALNQQTLAEPDSERKRAIAHFGQTLQSYFFLLVVFGGMAGMAIYSQFPKTHAVGLPILVYVSAGLAAAIYFQAGSQLALLVAFGEQVTSSLIQAAWGILTVAILWISFALGSGVWAFPISNGVGALVVLLAVRLVLVVTRHNVPLFAWSRQSDFLARLKAAWQPAMDCLKSQIASLLVFTLDFVFVGLFIGPGAAAVYGIVSRVMMISRQFLQSSSEAAWPRMAQETDAARKAALMRKLDRFNAWLVGSWFGAMAITLSPFLNWLAKPDWVAAPLLAYLIIVRHSFIALMSPHAYGLMGAGEFKILSLITWREVAVCVIAGISLGLTLGVNGVALAFLIANFSASGWMLTRYYFAQAHDTHWFSEWSAIVIRALLAGAISAALAWLSLTEARIHFGTMGWLAIIAGGIGFTVPTGFILLWKRAGKNL
jgi:O-antigen/teichoic acid export membrane protein